jgi:hypothetical protein
MLMFPKKLLIFPIHPPFPSVEVKTSFSNCRKAQPFKQPLKGSAGEVSKYTHFIGSGQELLPGSLVRHRFARGLFCS